MTTPPWCKEKVMVFDANSTYTIHITRVNARCTTFRQPIGNARFTNGGWHISLLYSLFVMRNFNYFLDKCGVLNEIIEQAIFIFKINPNNFCNTHLRRISKHNLIPISSVKIPAKH